MSSDDYSSIKQSNPPAAEPKLQIERPEIQSLLDLALAEDIGPGDLTTTAVLGGVARSARARIIAKQQLVVCGNDLAAAVFKRLNSSLLYRIRINDGMRAEVGETIAEIEGPLGSILTGERTALNFLQRLSGISTKTAAVIASLPNSGPDQKVAVLDTRKTTPGWRTLEKYGVAVGGGKNHRIGLFDAFLIKNNHVDALGGDIAAAIRRCREYSTAHPLAKRPLLQVEVRNQGELEAALAENPDAILLDTMSIEALRAAVATVRAFPGGGGIFLEASGGINEKTAPILARTGVNGLSIGALTHSAVAVDLALRFDSLL